MWLVENGILADSQFMDRENCETQYFGLYNTWTNYQPTNLYQFIIFLWSPGIERNDILTDVMVKTPWKTHKTPKKTYNNP